jgi:hypothetical protein
MMWEVWDEDGNMVLRTYTKPEWVFPDFTVHPVLDLLEGVEVRVTGDKDRALEIAAMLPEVQTTYMQTPMLNDVLGLLDGDNTADGPWAGVKPGEVLEYLPNDQRIKGIAKHIRDVARGDIDPLYDAFMDLVLNTIAEAAP